MIEVVGDHLDEGTIIEAGSIRATRRIRCRLSECAVAIALENLNAIPRDVQGRDVEYFVAIEIGDRDAGQRTARAIIFPGLQTAVRVGEKYRDPEGAIAAIPDYKVEIAVAIQVSSSNGLRVTAAVIGNWRKIIQGGAERSVSESRHVNKTKFAVRDDDVRNAIAIEVLHDCRRSRRTAGRIADGGLVKRAVSFTQENGDVGTTSVGKYAEIG